VHTHHTLTHTHTHTHILTHSLTLALTHTVSHCTHSHSHTHTHSHSHSHTHTHSHSHSHTHTLTHSLTHTLTPALHTHKLSKLKNCHGYFNNSKTTQASMHAHTTSDKTREPRMKNHMRTRTFLFHLCYTLSIISIITQ
jgi:hypothetical protein